MKKLPTIFPDVFIIEPDVFKDERGFFLESYSYKKYKALGIDYIFVQDNHAKSKINTIRGLHFSLYPGQVKLIRCTQGRIWDVFIDIRPTSPNFKKWQGVELTSDNFLQVLIPVGYAHGYAVLSETAEVQYKVSEYYDPQLEKEIYWNDPTLNIDWKVKTPLISNRDKNAPLLDDYLKIHPDPFI
ncbi:MAG: dTDP-4-dehydrorhamnose 3,5-epimerase [Promethearchaeota archaeon]